ncbi:MAG: hypothetical protein HEQ24_00050 [Dolichospermum sp. BR01]|nr:hypothetical protein [Dolichospermum sp. BR01]
MIYIITILIAIILIMSYLLFTKDNNQQQKIDTQGFRNAVKYNLIIKVFLDIFSQSQQLNTKFEKLTGDNESLKQEIHKFEQQITILHQEYQTVKKLKQRSNHSSSVDELQKQIAEKDTYIQNLELEKEDLEQYLEYIEIFGSEDLENYEYIYKLLLCRKVGTVHRIFTTVSIKILRSII